ncbi:MAG: twin-arginine translocation signal domain-containing protein, partial [Thermoguttaceae bacterium]
MTQPLKTIWSRRNFLQRTGILCAASLAGASSPRALAQDENSGPIDCGPPPQAKPQSRTGGESFAPLPLPVTPLRRSEKKRPPSPPALIGKVVLGAARWVTRDGQRTMYRD